MKCETSRNVNYVAMDMDMMSDTEEDGVFVCVNSVDRVSNDHNYTQKPNWMPRKTFRKRKSIERLSYGAPYQCVVCRRPFKSIGIKLNSVVCSKECLSKNM